MNSTGSAELDNFVFRLLKAVKPLDLKLRPPPSIPTSPKNLPLIGAVTAVAIAGVGWLGVNAAQRLHWTDRVGPEAAVISQNAR